MADESRIIITTFNKIARLILSGPPLSAVSFVKVPEMWGESMTIWAN